MEVKGSEPPDSPPPPYPGYPQTPNSQSVHLGPDTYYQNPPGGVYPNYDPAQQQQQQQQTGPYAQHQQYYTQQQHPPPQSNQYGGAQNQYGGAQNQYSGGPNPYGAQSQYTRQSGATGSPRHVIISQPHGMSGVVEVVSHGKPQSYLALSMVTCLCFSPLFGLIAICFSAASHSAYEHGDVLSAKRHGTTALLLCIFGIVLSLVILIIVLTAGVQWKPD